MSARPAKRLSKSVFDENAGLLGPLFTHSSNPAAIVDADSREILAVNPALAAFDGGAGQIAAGLTLSQIFHNDDFDSACRALAELKGGAQSSSFTARPGGNGSRWQWQLFRESDEAPHILLMGAATETALTAIGDSRQANSLTEAPQIGRVLESANICVWHWEQAGDKLQWELESSCGAMSPASTADWCARVSASDAQTFKKFLGNLRHAGAQGSVTFGVVTEDGGHRWYSTHAMTTSGASDTLNTVGILREITAERLSEIAALETRSRLQDAYFASEQWAWEWDPAEDTIEYFGPTPSWLEVRVGSADWALVSRRMLSGDRERQREAMLAALDNEDGRYYCEYRVLSTRGVIHWIEDRGRVMFDDAGTPRCLVASSTDVTERKQRELRLQSAEQQMRMVQETAGFWAWRIDLTNNRVEYLGESPPWEPAGLSSLTRFTEYLSVEDRGIVEQTMAAAVQTPGTVQSAEIRISAPDGRNWDILVRGRALASPDDTPRMIVGASVDITERRRSEQRLELAQRAAPIWYWERNLDTDEVVFLTDKPYTLFGDSQNTTYAAIRDYILPADADRLDKQVQEARSNGLTDVTFHYRMRWPDGSVHWIEVHSRILEDANGNLNRLLGVSVDVTERSVALEKLKENERLLHLAQSVAPVWNWRIDVESGLAQFLGVNDPWSDEPVETNGIERLLSQIEPQKRDAVRAAFDETVAEPGSTGQAEFWQHKGEDSRCLTLQWRSTRDEDGHTILVGATMDITEHKLRQQALEASENNLSSLIANLPGMAFRLERTQERGLWPVFVAPQASQLIGLDPEEFESGRVNFDADIVLPEDKQLTSAVRRAAIEAHDNHYETTYRVETRDGRIRWFNERAHIQYDDGQLLNIWGFTQDVTQQERFARMLTGMAENTMSSGEKFFTDLVKAIADTLDVRYVLVARVDETDPGQLRTLAVCDGESILENFQYGAALTPCGNVLETSTCFYRSSVQSHFPADKMLVDMGIQSYLGTPLVSSNGKRLGVLAVMDEGPIDEKLMPQRLIEMFGGRAAAELERHLIDLEYRRSNANYRGVFLASPDPIVVMDAGSGEILDVNDAACDQYGYEHEELVGRNADILSANTQSALQNPSALASAEFRPVHKRKDGSLFPVEMGLAHYEIEGRSTIAGVIKDISGRERDEQELRRSLATLESILESTEEGIVVTDRDGAVTHYNSNFLTMWKLTDAQMHETDISEVGMKVSDLLANKAVTSERLDALMHSDVEISRETVHLSDGRTFENYSQPLRLHDATIGRVFSQRDVTEKRRVAEKLETERALFKEILDANPAFIFVKDKDSRYLLANEAVLTNVGLTAEEIVGKSEQDIWGDGPQTLEMIAADQRVFASEQELRIEEEAVTDADNRTLWLQTIKRPLRNARGEVDRVLGVCTDITARKEAETRLRRAVAELGLAEERERKHLAALLHDNIVQDLGLAKIRLGGLRLGDWPTGKLGELDSLTELLNKTIRASRGLMFEISPPVLYDFGVKAALEWLAEHITEEKGTKFHLELDDVLNELITDIQVLLFQSTRELLLNISKHAQARRVWIRVDSDNEFVSLIVEDDGVGFEPPQVLVPRSESGYGLVSIRDRIDLIGGSLQIDSAPGDGTRITISLPRKARFAATRSELTRINKK